MSERPNILILIADQFRSDLVGVNGSPLCRTPNLDRLAAGGVSFSRAYTTTPLCTPARGALFTGRFTHSNRLTANTQYAESPTPRLPDDERLLFQHLASAGYRCGYVGKWHLGWGKPEPGQPENHTDEASEAARRGVADFYNGAAARRLQLEKLGLPPREDVGKAAQRIMRGDHPPMSGVTPYPEPYHLDSCIAGQAVDLLGQYAARPAPWAIVCSFHGPHFPIEVPEPYASMYAPADVPRPASFDDSFAGKPPGQISHPWLQLASHLSWEEWQRVIAHYWGFVTYIDSLIGRVLDALGETGQVANTIVLHTADHGEMAGHHRMFDKGPYLYDDVMRVPFIWRAPGQIVPRQAPDPQLVSHVDVLPTLFALTGVAPQPGSLPLHGTALVFDGGSSSSPSPLEGEGQGVRGAPERAIFGETNAADKVNPQLDTRMIVAERWKYVYRPGDIDELYDLAEDPDELRNLAGSPACDHVLSDLRQRLAAWMAETADAVPPPA